MSVDEVRRRDDFPSARPTRFNEMEYHLPQETHLPTLRKVREVLDSRHPEIFFPIEVRTVRGDDAWLSPFHGHERSGSIAVHHYHVEDPLPFFVDNDLVTPSEVPQGEEVEGRVKVMFLDRVNGQLIVEVPGEPISYGPKILIGEDLVAQD